MPRALLLCLLLCACRDPIKDAETFLARQQYVEAFRASHAARTSGKHTPEEQNHLLRIQVTAARRILQAPDTDDVGAALELFESLPDDLEDKARAGQRLLRVLARSKGEAELQAAYEKLQGQMGDESQVRSNLRIIAEENQGKPAAVWAARLVTTTWPDHYDRWLDRARAEASVGQFDDALKSLQEAEARLSTFCAELPARMAEYDKVRKESAYGQVEARRCKTFDTMAQLGLAYARGTASTEKLTARQEQAPGDAARVACPSGGNAADTHEVGIMVSPSATAWWLDGAMVKGPVQGAAAGEHTVVWKDGGVCRQMKVTLGRDEAVALRVAETP